MIRAMKLVERGIFTEEFLNRLPKTGRIPQEETTPLASILVEGLQKALLGTPEYLVELGKAFFKDPAGLSTVFVLSFERGKRRRFLMGGYISSDINNFTLIEYFGKDESIQRQITLTAIHQDSGSNTKVGEIGFVEHHKNRRGFYHHTSPTSALNNTYEAVQGVLKVIGDLNPQPYLPS